MNGRPAFVGLHFHLCIIVSIVNCGAIEFGATTESCFRCCFCDLLRSRIAVRIQLVATNLRIHLIGQFANLKALATSPPRTPNRFSRISAAIRPFQIRRD